ncbi:sensor domain-containing diguanylate cyclase [Desulfogranum mediterraneum]|uniref:sensor domain-containing diguanylate cyclase n=1 Tax=Desulfogranum mediterraneum TaxID=160661 RepID=UPI0004070942|nr:GGDEF domain-containing protein [Desulfogranum mediterraneum]
MTSNTEQVVASILQSQELPTLPVVASRLLSLTAREETTLADIANLISQDVGLSAKILRVANSSFYSFPQQIATINQAVSVLGTNAVRSLVLSFSFLSLNRRKKKSLFNFRKFWEESLIAAAAAKLILEQLDDSDNEEIFISGLLQNLGQLIFATTLPEEYDQILAELKNDPDQDEVALEKRFIGISHSLAGYAVAQRWGFPDSLLIPIRYHHAPDDFPRDQAGEETQAMLQNIHAVYLSGLLIKLYTSASPEEYHRQFRRDARRLLALSPRAINTVLRRLDLEIDQAASYFDLPIKNVKSVAEILQEANLRLSLLNLSYEEMNRELVQTKMKLEKLTEELANKNRLLENLANIDGLTEINNHRFFQNFLDNEINRAIRNERPITILLADIDHFKQFNDTYGHQTGDFILKEFCRVALENIREYDLMARYGGEEFVFVLPETNSDEALVVAEKIRECIATYPFSDGEHTYHVSISIGVATAIPQDRNFKKNEFIGMADDALYDAKGSGRNRVAAYSPKQKKKRWFKL